MVANNFIFLAQHDFGAEI